MLTLKKMMEILNEYDPEKQKAMIDALSEKDRKQLQKEGAKLREEVEAKRKKAAEKK